MTETLVERPVNFNLQNVQSIFDVLKKGNKETSRFLLNECAIIYECKVCTSLFRSLANFVAHKRFYCKEHKCESMVAFNHVIPGDIVEPEEPVEDVVNSPEDNISSTKEPEEEPPPKEARAKVSSNHLIQEQSVCFENNSGNCSPCSSSSDSSMNSSKSKEPICPGEDINEVVDSIKKEPEENMEIEEVSDSKQDEDDRVDGNQGDAKLTIPQEMEIEEPSQDESANAETASPAKQCNAALIVDTDEKHPEKVNGVDSNLQLPNKQADNKEVACQENSEKSAAVEDPLPEKGDESKASILLPDDGEPMSDSPEKQTVLKDANSKVELGQASPTSTTTSPTQQSPVVKVKENKIIINSNAKCTLKLTKGMMEKLFTPIDPTGLNKLEPKKPTYQILGANPDKKVNLLESNNPLVKNLGNGKRFAILNHQLFAKLIKENSKSITLEKGGVNNDKQESALSVDKNHSLQSPVKNEMTSEFLLDNKLEGCKRIIIKRPNFSNSEESQIKKLNESSQEAIKDSNQDKPDAKPTQIKETNKVQIELKETYEIKESPAKRLKTDAEDIRHLKHSSEQAKSSPFKEEAKFEIKNKLPSKSPGKDGYKDIKHLFADSDGDNTMSSDLDESKQEKKPLIVVISKSAKNQQPSDTGDESEEAIRPKKIYTCNVCNFKFGTKKSMRSHRTIVHEKKRLMFPCPFCDAALGQVWSVMRHITAIHKKSKEEIESLKKTIRRNAYYKDIDDGDDPLENDDGEGYPIGSLKCSRCYKPFDRRIALVTHERFCGRKGSMEKARSPRKERSNEASSPKHGFNADGDLVQIKQEPRDSSPEHHSRLPSPSKEKLSPPKSVASHFNASLNVHSRPKRIPNKKEYKDYVDSQTLKLSFINKSTSATSGVKVVKPPAPSTSFYTVKKEPSKMEAKIMEIIDLATLECLKCKKNFNNSSNLKRHSASHFGWCRFGCKVCKYRTYNKSDCKTHVAKAHKEFDPDTLIETLSDSEDAVANSTPVESPDKAVPSEETLSDEPQTERKRKRKNSKTVKRIAQDEEEDHYSDSYSSSYGNSLFVSS